jgi:hypothetical protein
VTSLKKEQTKHRASEKEFSKWLASQKKGKRQSKKAARTQRERLAKTYFAKHDPAYLKVRSAMAKAEANLKKFEGNNLVRVSIMAEMEKPRETFLLQRGAYDHPDKSTRLNPATFSVLPPMANHLPRNRLGLARWLFQKDHPLTARVAVNRYWQMYFGRGLVKSPEDFGSQGRRPTHPRLLDWLAVAFRESNWDVKAMQKRIVMSATYRQSSKSSRALQQKDPDNTLLARGPRFRMYAQLLRDQALFAGGLLSTKIGGRPVMPYQPGGLWEEVSAKGYKYIVG